MVHTHTARKALLRWAPLVIAIGLLLSACGGTSGSAVTVGGAPDVGSVTDAASGTGGTADGAGTTDASRTVAFDMSIRVANTYVTPKTAVPTAIEVWVGAPGAGKKLATVPYGQVSDFFAPEMLDPYGLGLGDGRQRFTINYYAAGATAASRSIGNESEPVSPGLKLTLVVFPIDPTEADSGQLGTSSQVFADAVGSGSDNAFTKPTLPEPPAGRAVLLFNAYALLGRPGMMDTSVGLTPSTADGKCLPYFEVDTGGLGYTGKLHDMTSYTFEMIGGTSNRVYPVEPGATVRLNEVKVDEGVTQSCADKPVLAPFNPKLATGQGAYGLIYGPDLAHAKILVIPVG